MYEEQKNPRVEEVKNKETSELPNEREEVEEGMRGMNQTVSKESLKEYRKGISDYINTA
jgi:hypothetical protein